jgi:hypothetical protein
MPSMWDVWTAANDLQGHHAAQSYKITFSTPWAKCSGHVQVHVSHIMLDFLNHA